MESNRKIPVVKLIPILDYLVANAPIEEYFDDCKVVQFILDEKPYLRFRERKDFHLDIINDFLYECGIADDKSPLIIPKIRGERYEVVGAGKIRPGFNKRKITFTGRSTDYGIGISGSHLDSIREELRNQFKDFQIEREIEWIN